MHGWYRYNHVLSALRLFHDLRIAKISQGKDAEAVRIVHEVARRNGTTSALTVKDLEAFNVGGTQGTEASAVL